MVMDGLWSGVFGLEPSMLKVVSQGQYMVRSLVRSRLC